MGDVVNTVTPDKETVRKEKINKIWSEMRNSFIYDPLRESVCFINRRPTDYKMNKHVNLPKPLSAESEFECELRRKEFSEVFDKYIKDNTEKDNKLDQVAKSETNGKGLNRMRRTKIMKGTKLSTRKKMN